MVNDLELVARIATSTEGLPEGKEIARTLVSAGEALE